MVAWRRKGGLSSGEDVVLKASDGSVWVCCATVLVCWVWVAGFRLG
jgi:hypothetical protein